MKTTIQILLVLLIATACRKPGNKNAITIEGQLMSSCNTPAANKSGFILTNDGLLSGPGISLNFTTDENGFFKITHTGKEDVSSFMVRVQGSSDVLNVTGLPGDNKDLGKVYINPPRVSYYLRLEVNNPYTNLDTLVYYDWGYPQNGSSHWLKKISGPFETGVIDSVVNIINMHAMPLRWSDVSNGIAPKMPLEYFLNEYDSGDQKALTISTPYCVDEYQTVTLVID